MIINSLCLDLILVGTGVMPTVPEPSTLIFGDKGFNSSSDLMIGQRAYNVTDNVVYRRSLSGIEVVGELTIDEREKLSSLINVNFTTLHSLPDEIDIDSKLYQSLPEFSACSYQQISDRSYRKITIDVPYLSSQFDLSEIPNATVFSVFRTHDYIYFWFTEESTNRGQLRRLYHDGTVDDAYSIDTQFPTPGTTNSTISSNSPLSHFTLMIEKGKLYRVDDSGSRVYLFPATSLEWFMSAPNGSFYYFNIELMKMQRILNNGSLDANYLGPLNFRPYAIGGDYLYCVELDPISDDFMSSQININRLFWSTGVVDDTYIISNPFMLPGMLGFGGHICGKYCVVNPLAHYDDPDTGTPDWLTNLCILDVESGELIVRNRIRCSVRTINGHVFIAQGGQYYRMNPLFAYPEASLTFDKPHLFETSSIDYERGLLCYDSFGRLWAEDVIKQSVYREAGSYLLERLFVDQLELIVGMYKTLQSLI